MADSEARLWVDIDLFIQLHNEGANDLLSACGCLYLRDSKFNTFHALARSPPTPGIQFKEGCFLLQNIDAEPAADLGLIGLRASGFNLPMRPAIISLITFLNLSPACWRAPHVRLADRLLHGAARTACLRNFSASGGLVLGSERWLPFRQASRK